MTTAGEKTSWATPTSASKTIQPSTTQQQQRDLVEGLEDAMSIISTMLQTSSEVKEQFKCDREAALTSYQIDIGIIEEEIKRMTLEHHKLRGNKKSVTNGFSKLTLSTRDDNNNNNHQHQELDSSNDVSVPPTDTDDTEVQVETASLSENHHEIDSKPTDDIDIDVYSTDSSTVTSEPQPTTITISTKNDKEQTRFDSVTSLLTSIEFFREEEAELLKLLNDAKPKDNGMTGHTSQERLEIEEKLEACRARLTQTVTDYKPRRFKATNEKLSLAKAHDLGLNLPSSIDLENAVKAVPIGGGSKRSSLAAHSFKQTPKKNTNAPGNALTLNYRDVFATRMNVLLKPDDHLLTVHELSVETPASKRSPESSSKQSRSLSALVKSNTRPLNSMELGRRHRIDKK